MDTTKSEVYLTMKKETLVKIIDNKRECIKMLKERIDKAIEYIKQYGNLYCLKGKQFKDYQQYKDLLNILKGSDKNV